MRLKRVDLEPLIDCLSEKGIYILSVEPGTISSSMFESKSSIFKISSGESSFCVDILQDRIKSFSCLYLYSNLAEDLKILEMDNDCPDLLSFRIRLKDICNFINSI